MNVVITDDALARLDHQIIYIADRGATQAARQLYVRVHEFLTLSLPFAPRRGRYIADHDMWETWIPGTKFVVWYIFDDNRLTVIDLWHTSQNRLGAIRKE